MRVSSAARPIRDERLHATCGRRCPGPGAAPSRARVVDRRPHDLVRRPPVTTSQSSSLPLVSSSRPHDPMSATWRPRSTGTSPSARARPRAARPCAPAPPERGQRLPECARPGGRAAQRAGAAPRGSTGRPGSGAARRQKRASSLRYSGTCEDRAAPQGGQVDLAQPRAEGVEQRVARPIDSSTAPACATSRQKPASGSIGESGRAARPAGRSACAGPCSRAPGGARAAARPRGRRACRGARHRVDVRGQLGEQRHEPASGSRRCLVGACTER